jgi:6-phosphofructokinase 1
MSAHSSINKIGVFTSGGDAPGMNAAIRAVVRAAEFYNIKPMGIYRGYEGLMDGDFVELHARSVSNIISRGGTILKSARSQRFRTAEGRKLAFENVKKAGIDALVAIGGDGTFTGASVFLDEHNVPTIGIPGTIDNDLSGTDFTIGYDTACNTVIHAVDAIRDTASSHNRLFFIEVMGRDSGFIAMRSGIAAGVEFILVPECEMTIEDLVKKLECSKKKSSGLVIVAEGLKMGGAMEIAAKVKERFAHYDTKVTVLGHIQRGGSPSCLDREIAGRMGVAAIEGLLQGKKNVMVGIVNGSIVYSSFEEVVNNPQPINFDLLRINEILSV